MTNPATPVPAAPASRLRLSPLWLAFAALTLAIPVAPLLLARRPAALPDLGRLPAFSLVDQRNRPFGSSDLRGKVWVADFVFTSCSDACPRLTAKMRSLQDSIGPDPRIGLLSITVDPENDTPRKLAEYAKLSGANDDAWRFLTGDPTEVERTVVRGFHIAMGKAPAPAKGGDELRMQAFDIMHGDRFVLVDSQTRIRGYYVADDEGLRALLRDARSLADRPEPEGRSIPEAAGSPGRRAEPEGRSIQ